MKLESIPRKGMSLTEQIKSTSGTSLPEYSWDVFAGEEEAVEEPDQDEYLGDSLMGHEKAIYNLFILFLQHRNLFEAYVDNLLHQKKIRTANIDSVAEFIFNMFEQHPMYDILDYSFSWSDNIYPEHTQNVSHVWSELNGDFIILCEKFVKEVINA